MQLSAISLAITRIGRIGLSPASLFASGEQGAWYDPSDLTTMFQAITGVTPVTADGQTVGLILDKSKGLVLGPELIVGAPGPYTGNGTISVNGDTITATCTTNGVYGIDWEDSTISNIWTKVGVEVVTNSAGKQMEVFVNLAVSATINFGTTIGNKSGIQFAPAASGGVAKPVVVIFAGIVGESFSVRLTSIKELHGNHASQNTAAARPLKASTGNADWVNYDGADDVLNATFASSLGSLCTVARANVGGAPTILTGQTIGTSYADSTDNAGLIIIDRALTTQETTDLTAWLTAKGATA